MKKLMVTAAVLVAVLGVSVTPASAKTKVKPLKSCIAALDAAESVGVESELYEENAKRCRTGINTPEKVAKTSNGPYTPTPADFSLSIVTLGQQCFGSAGCLIDYRIDVSYVGAQLPDEDTTYQVIYEVHGGEDVLIDSFELTGTMASIPSQSNISTPPAPVLTAVVTNVIDN